MTREEAIKIIKNDEECVLTDCFRPSCESCNLVMETDAILTALDMAIKALEQTEPCEAGTKMSLPEREDGDELDEAIRFEERAAEAYSEAHNQFHDNVDPADAECCLNRAARHRQLASWLRELQRLREQGTCDDAVSRVDVLECFSDLYDTFEDCSKGIVNELHRKFEDLRTLPSVTPKQDDWIMCSERLPEEPTEVMHELEMYSEYNVVIEGFTIPTTLCYVGDGEWRREESYYNVEKWQPLPKP